MDKDKANGKEDCRLQNVDLEKDAMGGVDRERTNEAILQEIVAMRGGLSLLQRVTRQNMMFFEQTVWRKR